MKKRIVAILAACVLAASIYPVHSIATGYDNVKNQDESEESDKTETDIETDSNNESDKEEPDKIEPDKKENNTNEDNIQDDIEDDTIKDLTEKEESSETQNNENETETETEIETEELIKLPQNMTYTCDTYNEAHEYGEPVTFRREGDIYGGISSYESDENGEKINGGNLEIANNYSTIIVTGKNVSNDGTPFYFTVEDSGDETHLPEKRTYQFYVEKVKLTGEVKLTPLESGNWFYRTKRIYVEVAVRTENDYINLNNAKNDISFELEFYDNNNKKNVGYTFRGAQYSQGTLTYRYEVNYSDSKRLGSDVSVTASAQYTKDMYKFISLKSAQTGTKQAQISIKSDDITMELNNDSNKLYFNLSGDIPYDYSNYPVDIKFESLNEDVITIDENACFKTLTGGEAVIRITVDDAQSTDSENNCDFYEKSVKEITVKVTAPTNIDYTINGQNPTYVIGSPKAKVDTENWYEDKLVIQKGENNLYTNLVYREKGNDSWTSIDMTNDNSLVIDNDTITSYEFYFEDENRKVKSEKILELNNIGIDTGIPNLNKSLIADATPSTHSTQTTSYFPDSITLKVTSDNETEPVDKGSGVESIVVIYRKSGIIMEKVEYKVAEESRYNTYYEVEFEKDKNYGNVEIIAVDYLGHESIAASYEKEICIDKKTPIVTLESEDIDYKGEWINQPIKYIISSLEESQVSGIYRYQYAFVPNGEDIEPQWRTIDQENLYILLGGSKLSDEYINMNGTIYVRAESNAGLVTTSDDIENTKKELRLWRQNLKEPTVNFDKAPDADTGWYNNQTGDVTISFEYPEYDEKILSPAVGIVYTLTTSTAPDGEETSITKSFYKGIINENTGEVIEVSDYKDESKITSLKAEGTIHIDKDSINKLTVYAVDAAGNRSSEVQYEIKADYNAPDNLVASTDDTDLKVYLSDSGDSIPYVIFSQNAVNVNASAAYGISGRGSLNMELAKDKGSVGNTSYDRDRLTIEPCNRGLVYICAIDGAGNRAQGWTDGIVVDNLSPQDILISTEGENKAGFYNTNIPLKIKVKDSPTDDNYAGLSKVSYQVGRSLDQLSEEIILKQDQLSNLSWEQIQSLFSYESKDLLINADQNESNNAVVKVTATDNAGNLSTMTKELKIDVTKPIIEISFDNNSASNQLYYNAPRRAKIDITELNFDASLVEFRVFKDGNIDYTQNLKLTSWTSSEDLHHIAYITFDEDGDYYFEVKCKDLAGNESTLVKTEQFTIDLTKPLISVEYDNNNPWKENYYNGQRTATITVTEHNFDEKGFAAAIEPKGSITGWINNGDKHQTTIHFDEEEYYSYTLSVTDLAGNSSNDFVSDDFYIDLTLPEITITGVTDHSANSGDISPRVRMTDLNFDGLAVEISLENSKGKRINVTNNIVELENGYEYFLTNVNGQPDEIYTLSANTTDMAGNKSEAQVKFSLNRQGSVYDLSQITMLADKGYIRSTDIEDIHITEMNVNSIEEFILVMTKNNKAITTTKVDKRPSALEADVIYYSALQKGNDDIGYVYDYTIYKESFEDEGIYNATFYSKDKAGNEVNNTLDGKNAGLTFIIDNSSPDVVIDGVDSDNFKLDEEKEVNIYIRDNFKLTEAYIELVDEDGIVIERYDYLALSKNEGDVVTITLPSSEKIMSLRYYASDAAGNEIRSLQEYETPKAAGVSMAAIGEDNTPTFMLMFIFAAFLTIILIGASIKLIISKFTSK
jgi:hypothetical protein